MWLRPLESRSGLHTGLVRRILKDLLALKAITEIKSADTSKKVYISVDAKPDDKHIGGGFIDDGKFDIAMIDAMTFLATDYLQDRGWHKADIRVSDEQDKDSKAATKQKHKSKTPAPRPSKSSKEQAVVTIEETNDEPAPPRERKIYPPWSRRGHNLIPLHPSAYTSYPSTMDVMFQLNENGALKDMSMTLKDTEQLLEKMAFDGHVERMRDNHGEMNMKEPRWRAAKRTWKREMKSDSNHHFGHVEPVEDYVLPGNGLSQVPCARCPVKAKCKPGGVISPEECKYLDEWLAF